MEIGNEKKIELKALISSLYKISGRLESKQNALTSTMLNHVLLLLIYTILTVVGCIFVTEDLHIIAFEFTNAVFFILLVVYLKEIQSRKMRAVISESNVGYKKFEKLVNYVDWRAYRIKQLHSETDDKVIAALERFSNVVEQFFSPKKSGINYYRIFTICFIAWRLILLSLSVIYFKAEIFQIITEFKNNTIVDTKFACLSIIPIFGVLIIWILYRIVSLQRKLTDAYTVTFNNYLSKFTYFCKLIYEFSQCVVVRDRKKEYVEDITSLMGRFSKLGKQCSESTTEYDANSFNVNTISGLSENINHLWYYIDDKLRYTDGGIQIDNETLSKRKETILSEAAGISLEYTGSKVGWDLIWSVSGDLYCNDWLKIQDLPYIYNSANSTLKSFRRLIISFAVLISITALMFSVMWSSLQMIECISIVVLEVLIACFLFYRQRLLLNRYNKLYSKLQSMQKVQ